MKIAIIVSLLIFNMSVSYAQDVSSMKPVVVEASRSNTKLKDMPFHTTIITRKQLEENPAITIDQVIRQQAGINMQGINFQNLDPSAYSMNSRGMPGFNTSMMVLLDGIPIMDPLFGVAEWSRVPMGSIERVEIIRGGQSMMWGGQAGNGVINIISKKAAGNGFNVDIGYGMQNTERYQFAKNIEVNDKLNLRFSGSRMTSDGYNSRLLYYDGNWNQPTLPGIDLYGNPATVQNLSLDGFYKVDSTLNMFLKFGIQEDERTRTNALGTNIDHSKTIQAGITKRFNDIHTFTSNAYFQNVNLAKNNSSGCFSITGTSCSQTTSTGPGIPDGKVLIPYVTTYEWIPATEVGNNAVFSKDYDTSKYGSKYAYSTGIDYKHTQVSDKAQSFQKPGVTTALPPSIAQDASVSTIGIFGQLRLRPVEIVEITTGLRYDNWFLENQSVTTGSSRVNTPDSNYGHLSPSAMGKLFISEQVALRGGWYQSYQAPKLSELYRSGITSASVDFGNHSLKPQITSTFEIGTDLTTIKYGAYNITAFSTDIKNASYRQNLGKYTTNPITPAQQMAYDLCLTTTACTNGFTTTSLYTNGINATVQGVEITGRLPIGDKFVLTGNHTISKSHLTSVGTGQTDPLGQQIGGVPTHITTGGVSMQFTEKWNTYVGVRNVGKSYIDTAHKYAVDGFTTVDLSSQYRLNKYAQIYVNAMNVGNKLYSDSGAASSTSSMRTGMPLYVFGGIRLTF